MNEKTLCQHCGHGAFSTSGFVHQRTCPDFTERKIDFCWDSTMDALRAAVGWLPNNKLTINPRAFWDLYIPLKERREGNKIPLDTDFRRKPSAQSSSQKLKTLHHQALEAVDRDIEQSGAVSEQTVILVRDALGILQAGT